MEKQTCFRFMGTFMLNAIRIKCTGATNPTVNLALFQQIPPPILPEPRRDSGNRRFFHSTTLTAAANIRSLRTERH